MTDILDRAGDFLTSGLAEENLPAMQNLSVECYRALATGIPATHQELSDRAALPLNEVGRLLAAHPVSAIERSDDDAILAFNGLTLSPTVHRFEVERRTLYTWCVFDALFLPQVLAKPATLSTRCPVSDQEIAVRVAVDRLEHVEPSGIVMSLVAPDRQASCDNLRGAFCNHVSFFRDQAAFDQAVKGQLEIIGINAEEAMSLALRRNQLRYPDLIL